jgi:Bax protein
MNMPLFLHRHRSLVGLVVVLILAFVIATIGNKNQPQKPQDAGQAQAPTSKAVEPQAAVLAPHPTTQPASAPRTMSSANAAASISHAIESSLRPKVMPLPDFSAISDVKDKKTIFFKYLTNLAQTANNKVIQVRAEIQRMNPQRLTHFQVQRLDRLAKSHKIKTTDAAQQIDLLLRKIDQVPTALVLAQAANESAWGTSRFATQGNNLFGQWCFSQGCGLIPSGRPEGATYEVRKFNNPQESVDAYIRNLNSHASYIGLRRIRECLINYNQDVSGRALAAGLIGYSSRGVAYIDDIRVLIRVNRLEPWHKSWWGNNTHHPCSALVKLERPATVTEGPIHGITFPETS